MHKEQAWCIIQATYKKARTYLPVYHGHKRRFFFYSWSKSIGYMLAEHFSKQKKVEIKVMGKRKKERKSKGHFGWQLTVAAYTLPFLYFVSLLTTNDPYPLQSRFCRAEKKERKPDRFFSPLLNPRPLVLNFFLLWASITNSLSFLFFKNNDSLFWEPPSQKNQPLPRSSCDLL